MMEHLQTFLDWIINYGDDWWKIALICLAIAIVIIVVVIILIIQLAKFLIKLPVILFKCIIGMIK